MPDYRNYPEEIYITASAKNENENENDDICIITSISMLLNQQMKQSQQVSVYSVTTVKKDALKNIIKDVEKRGYSTSTAA